MNSSVLTKFCDFIAKHYGNGPGKMLVHTGVIGWIMSSAAQIVAIAINDKIPKEQKMFMIPQEIADAFVNILSFYLVTNTFKNVGQNLVKTGKWIPKNVKEFLANNKLATNLGKKGYDVLAKLKGLNTGSANHIIKDFEKFGNGVDIGSTFAGSVLSCNIITPLLRNVYASYSQKNQLAKLNEKSDKSNLAFNNSYCKPRLADFQSASNRSSLKI